MDAENVAQIFAKVNSLFSTVHTLVSHSRLIPLEDLPEIRENINNYMTFFRKTFPNKVTPKMHFLEEHVPQWIENYGLGVGLHGEQGGEGVHRVFNDLKRTHSATKHKLQQLEAIMKDHLLSVHPAIVDSNIKSQKINLSTKNMK